MTTTRKLIKLHQSCRFFRTADDGMCVCTRASRSTLVKGTQIRGADSVAAWIRAARKSIAQGRGCLLPLSEAAGTVRFVSGGGLVLCFLLKFSSDKVRQPRQLSSCLFRPRSSGVLYNTVYGLSVHEQELRAPAEFSTRPRSSSWHSQIIFS
jgi:hypothetical protein